MQLATSTARNESRDTFGAVCSSREAAGTKDIRNSSTQYPQGSSNALTCTHQDNIEHRKRLRAFCSGLRAPGGNEPGRSGRVFDRKSPARLTKSLEELRRSADKLRDLPSRVSLGCLAASHRLHVSRRMHVSHSREKFPVPLKSLSTHFCDCSSHICHPASCDGGRMALGLSISCKLQDVSQNCEGVLVPNRAFLHRNLRR